MGPPRIFSIILFRKAESFITFGGLTPESQLKLHFERSLCNTLTWDVLFERRLGVQYWNYDWHRDC